MEAYVNQHKVLLDSLWVLMQPTAMVTHSFPFSSVCMFCACFCFGSLLVFGASFPFNSSSSVSPPPPHLPIFILAMLLLIPVLAALQSSLTQAVSLGIHAQDILNKISSM